jgi:hypothetical protein
MSETYHLVNQHTFPWQKSILKIVDDPSLIIDPNKGDRYLISNTPTASLEFESYPNYITYFDGNEWRFIQPEEAWMTYNKDDTNYYRFDGSEWVIFTGGAIDYDIVQQMINTTVQPLADRITWIEENCCNSGGGQPPPTRPFPNLSTETDEYFDGYKWALPASWNFDIAPANEAAAIGNFDPANTTHMANYAKIVYDENQSIWKIQGDAGNVYYRAYYLNKPSAKMYPVGANGDVTKGWIREPSTGTNLSVEIKVPGKTGWLVAACYGILFDPGSYPWNDHTLTYIPDGTNCCYGYNGANKFWDIQYALWSPVPAGWFYVKLTFNDSTRELNTLRFSFT